MARAFIRLHEDWISTWLGQQPVRDPAEANVKLHISSASGNKEGASIGAALTREHSHHSSQRYSLLARPHPHPTQSSTPALSPNPHTQTHSTATQGLCTC